MAFKNAIVLTGGIATGKSTVANLFLADGFFLIDADTISHEILDLHQEKIVALFGKDYLFDGKINRKKLGVLIFSNKNEKKRLEILLHPLIYREIEKRSEELDKLNSPYIIDIPLFFESSRYPIDKSIVVYTPILLQQKRLMQRDGSTQDESQQRINSQMSIEQKREKATYLIDNSKDLNHLQDEYVKVREEIRANFKELL